MKFFDVFFLISLCLCMNDYYINNSRYINESYFEAEMNFDITNNKKILLTDYNTTQKRDSNTEIKPITNVKLTVSLECDDILHITINDINNNRWDPSKYLITYPKQYCNKSLSQFGVNISIRKNNTYKITLTNNKTNETYYEISSDLNFLFSDTLLIYQSLLTSNDIYGYGERDHQFKLGDGIFTLYPNDTGGVHYDDGEGGSNLMGHQPIGLHRTKGGLFIGEIFMNTNPQDVVIDSLTYQPKILFEHRTTGGFIDIYIVKGDTPDDVLIKMQRIYGRPTMPPLWALGYHHSRYGYKDESDLLEVRQYDTKYGIPYDGVWSDIDTLDGFRVFTIGSKFKNLPILVDEFHEAHKHYIPIVDYGIKVGDDSIYKDNNCLIKSNYTKENLISFSWPGEIVLPDFFNKDTISIWEKSLQKYSSLVHFDGLWLDMNEPAANIALPGEIIMKDKMTPSLNRYSNLPYIPGYKQNHTDLHTHTVSENGYSPLDPSMLTIFNTKPLIPYLQSKSTYEFLSKGNKRPFILSRGNTIGQGKYSFHWLGDNESSWEHLKRSIAGIFNYNIFGIPMTGADICGFLKNATDTLCARWYTLGAFYPLSRNHNDKGSISQLPWKVGKLTLLAAKRAIQLRYSLIRYLYSQLYEVSLGIRGSVFKPLFFEYQNDINVYKEDIIDWEIMFGKSFLLIPVLSESEEDVKAYFPNDDWNDIKSGKAIVQYDSKYKDKGKEIYLSGKYESIHLYLRGGQIVPYQSITQKVRSTFELLKEPIDIIINPNYLGYAYGDIYFDNESLDISQYLKIAITFNKNSITFERFDNILPDNTNININKIKIFNIAYFPFVNFAILQTKNSIKYIRLLKKDSVYELNLHSSYSLLDIDSIELCSKRSRFLNTNYQ